MKTEPARSPEFAKFDALVGRVLSVSPSEIQKRIADEKRTAAKRTTKKKHA
jgi:hypothetical protein